MGALFDGLGSIGLAARRLGAAPRRPKRWGGLGYVALAPLVLLGSVTGGALMASTVAVASPATGSTGWGAIEAPLPTNAGTGSDQFADLGTVSCPSPGSCTAVGGYFDGGADAFGLIDTLSGGTWTATQAPEPAHSGTATADQQFAVLNSVSCTADGGCTAVGSYEDDNGNSQPLIDTLSGGAWIAVPAPLPTNNGINVHDATALYSVSCTSATACTAVGGYSESSGAFEALIETLSGGTWTATQAPLPANAGNATFSSPYPELYSVSCTSDGGCTAVGQYTADGVDSYGVIDTLSGGTWTATEAPQPSSGASDQFTFLNSVSCISAGSCTTVGVYSDTANYPYGLIDTLSAGSWSTTQAPEPAGAGTDADTFQFAWLSSVSCTSDGGCTAAGFYSDKNNTSFGLLETLTAGKWTSTQAPEPAGAGSGQGAGAAASLSSVVCESAGHCTAVGLYTDTSGTSHGLIDAVSGSSWNTIAAPEPSSPGTDALNLTELNSVSCPSDGSCTAVGIAPDQGGMIDSFTPAVPLQITTTSPLPAGKIKTAYSVTLSASNGNPPYTWKLVKGSGKLPAGLKLSSSGALSGKPKKSGTFTFSVEVLDQKTKTKPKTQNTATQAFSITVT